MSEQGSVSQWIGSLKDGEQDAASEIWRRFHMRLVSLAQKKLRSAPQRTADAEDIVLDAFNSFFRRAEEGQFPSLDDRDDLWQLLVTIAERKALNQIRDQMRQKRGGGQVRGESVFRRASDAPENAGLDQMNGDYVTPEDAAITVETLDAMLTMLGPEERCIAIYKLEGRSNVEIASILECAVSTIERRLRLIRRKWSDGSDLEPD